MVLIATVVLAFVYLPWPWSGAAIAVAAAWEVSGAVLSIRYSRRGRAQVGVETLVGRTASVITPLAPDGQVKVNGEIWQAHYDHGVPAGEAVLITAVDGMTLEVEPAPGSTTAQSEAPPDSRPRSPRRVILAAWRGRR
jgi:membrane protein implicated in regulation of membrane protease activity